MFIILGLFLCVSSIGLYSTAKAADWPNWRGAGYNGISRETGWLTKWPEDGPEVLWEASIGIGLSSITVNLSFG